MPHQAFSRALLLVVLAGLAACGVRPTAVVVDRSGGNPSPRATPATAPAEYVVRRGDTLYGIAFRHGLELRQVAAANRIGPPYTIYPGQRLQLRGSAAARPAPPPATTTPVRPTSPAPSRPIAAAPPPAAPRPATPATPAPATPVSPPAGSAGALGWRWPAQGQVVAQFVAGDPTRQGINIAGSAGQAVYAAAPGVVVYSGSGLIGYGELIIIKHDDTLLSAYGHNRKRLVDEGAQVTAGQQIAEMGRSGAARDMLHFEIRRHGKPVNPLGLLPAR